MCASDSACPCHICTGTRLTAGHVCTGTGLSGVAWLAGRRVRGGERADCGAESVCMLRTHTCVCFAHAHEHARIHTHTTTHTRTHTHTHARTHRCNYAAEIENLDGLFALILDEVERQVQRRTPQYCAVRAALHST